MKSVKPIEPSEGPGAGPDDRPPPFSSGRDAEADFRGQMRTNATHASTTDPEAKLYRKGPGMETRLSSFGHALMENRCGLVVDACLTQANGHAERLAALAMIAIPATPLLCRPAHQPVHGDEDVVAASEARKLEERVRELELLLGRKTMEVEIRWLAPRTISSDCRNC